MLPRKIILAEDDADDRQIFHDFLKDRPDIVLLSAVENGEDILHLLPDIDKSGNRPDLILLDQNMPKKNGLQTLQALKENSVYKDIPVFIYSTYADEGLHQQSTKAGAASVFSKPYTAEGYQKLIDTMLRFIG